MTKNEATLEDAPVGSIWTTSWGYDQTNVEAYEVTRVVSRTKREVRQIALESDRSTGWASDRAKPVAGEFIGGAKMVTIIERGYGLHFYPEGTKYHDFISARPWHGQSQHRSWYA